MVVIRPFRALRPNAEQASRVASPPYDVINTAEARELADGNDVSFLRVIRAEIEFPEGADAYSEEVYQRGHDNLQKLSVKGAMEREDAPAFFLYQQVMGAHTQIGIVATASCAEYDRDDIRKHEFTRPDKEADRVRHVETLKAQTGPVWMTYKAVPSIDAIVSRLSADAPEVSFTAPDGIKHSYWAVRDAADIEALTTAFAKDVPLLYIADGHHRSAAASRVAASWRDKGVDASHPSQFFLSVIYPDDQLQILAYNRYVKDLNGMSKEEFLAKVEERFSVDTAETMEPPSPAAAKHFDMFLDGQWYSLQIKPALIPLNAPVGSLDVSLLQNELLAPLLAIEDPRTSARVQFVGGIRGHGELEKLVSASGGVAFACYPTSIGELLDVADAHEVMPPKSTWFEPKLRSGLFVHLLSDDAS